MQYAAHLPNTRSMLAPVVALAIGAAGATGIYAALDDNAANVQPAPVVITQTSPATSGPNEASVAAAVGSQAPAVSGPNEASVAAAVAHPPTVSSPGKDESSTAAAIGRSTAGPSSSGPDEASVASFIGGPH